MSLRVLIVHSLASTYICNKTDELSRIDIHEAYVDQHDPLTLVNFAVLTFSLPI